MVRRAPRDDDILSPSLILRAYVSGIFPMADSADDPSLYWIEPRQRGILPLDDFHIPRRLRRTVRTTPLSVTVDTDFRGVIEGCAASRPGRRGTWINATIRDLYGLLFRSGHVHTIEVRDGERLVGGLYGVHIGAAFFGESMFSDMRDASKIALVHLAGRLRKGGFALLDTQFLTEHLSQFGGIEIERDLYLGELAAAVSVDADFFPFDEDQRPGGRLPVPGRAVLEALGSRDG